MRACRGSRPAALAFVVLFFASCARHPSARTVPRHRPAPPPPAVAGISEEGLASWYGGGDGFEGKPTASGEIMDGHKLTAAHRTLPLGTWVDVVNATSGQSVRVKINDRGPFVKGRIIDLSREAARQVGAIGPGVVPVRITVVAPGPAVLELSPSGRWSVQIGSFASAYRGEMLASRVRATGRPVYTEPYGGLTRVKVGPLESKEAAARELARLEAEGYEGILAPDAD